MGHMFLLMPIYHFQVKCSRLLAHSDPKKGLLGHGCKDCLWFSVLRVWALCKLLQTCWRGWCPRCWFPPGVTSHHLQSRGILECVNWSCRPAAASLPPGRVLEKKTKISMMGQRPGIGMKCQVRARSKMEAAGFQEHFSPVCIAPFPHLQNKNNFPWGSS